MKSFWSLSLSLVLTYLPFSSFADDNDHWDTRFGPPGADGLVLGITGSGSDVYLAGSFASAGESGCLGIAKWNGTNWTGFGSGIQGVGPIGWAFAMRGSDVYFGGAFFTNISGVPVRALGKWNGTTWSEVGGGLDGAVTCLRFVGNDLYVGGLFTQAGGIRATNIARWDGTNWWPLGTGLDGYTNGPFAVVYSLAVAANGDLIAGGIFRYADGIEVNNVARWDGSHWHGLGSGVYDGGPGLYVSAVGVLDTNVYVAGLFRSASGVSATNIARWDGTQWRAMGGSSAGTNTSVAFVGTNIYIAGHFTNIGGVAIRGVARWDGQAWQPLAAGAAGEIPTRVYCLGVAGTNLYAGGDFTRAGNAGALGAAKWDGNQWSALAGPKSQGAWFSSPAIAADGANIYIGGNSLITAGGVKVSRIAHWNGNAWDNMGGGVSGGTASVNAIAKIGANIYVGGNFTNAGGVAARNIAWWDGANWHAMASGLDSNVNAIITYNGQIYAGGAFRFRADGSGGFLFGVAQWDGSDWQGLGISAGRVDNAVSALATDGASLYVGGKFEFDWSSPGGGDWTTNIARWDGSWHKLGVGIGPTVNAMALMGSDLYVGGTFTNAGTVLTRRLAKWNGGSWSEVGGGITNMFVFALAARGSTLYVGGSFTNVGSPLISRLAQWDGSQWHSLGSGVTRVTTGGGSVAAFALSTNDLYMVGNFTYAGGRPSSYFAHWNETVAFVPPVVRLINFGRNGSRQFHFDISGLSSGPYTVEVLTNTPVWTPVYTGDAALSTNFTDVNSPNIPWRNYRVKVPWP